jgi:hypothetical protein
VWAIACATALRLSQALAHNNGAPIAGDAAVMTECANVSGESVASDGAGAATERDPLRGGVDEGISASVDVDVDVGACVGRDGTAVGNVAGNNSANNSGFGIDSRTSVDVDDGAELVAIDGPPAEVPPAKREELVRAHTNEQGNHHTTASDSTPHNAAQEEKMAAPAPEGMQLPPPSTVPHHQALPMSLPTTTTRASAPRPPKSTATSTSTAARTEPASLKARVSSASVSFAKAFSAIGSRGADAERRAAVGTVAQGPHRMNASAPKGTREVPLPSWVTGESTSPSARHEVVQMTALQDSSASVSASAHELQFGDFPPVWFNDSARQSEYGVFHSPGPVPMRGLARQVAMQESGYGMGANGYFCPTCDYRSADGAWSQVANHFAVSGHPSYSQAECSLALRKANDMCMDWSQYQRMVLSALETDSSVSGAASASPPPDGASGTEEYESPFAATFCASSSARDTTDLSTHGPSVARDATDLSTHGPSVARDAADLSTHGPSVARDAADLSTHGPSVASPLHRTIDEMIVQVVDDAKDGKILLGT